MASPLLWVGVSLIMIMFRLMRSSTAQMAPALFMFGDSLIDVGNNNYLPLCMARANFPHNGIDFPTQKATGRFSNGKNAADFIAEKLGLPSSPAYLSLVHNKSTNFVNGVSFASGGAGIFDATNLHWSPIAMNKQIEHYTKVHEIMVQQLGHASAHNIISKSVFAIVIGSNDILGYFGSSQLTQMKKDYTPQQYLDSMVLSIKDQLKQIYDFGGRKFVMVGVGVVGCVPSQRDKNKTDACNEEANFWASKYNQGLLSVLQQYQTELKDFQYTYVDAYYVLLNIIQHPDDYGFKEVKAACCGLGNLNAKVPCLPTSSYCPNRSDHVFWDFFHPTEAVARIVIDTAFNGPHQYAFPGNVQELVSDSLSSDVLASSVFS